jgi:hypothetical protein
MKYILIFLFTLLLFSCQTQKTLRNIYGVWEITSFQMNGDETMDRYKVFTMEYCQDKNKINLTDWSVGDYSPETMSETFQLNSSADSVNFVFDEHNLVFINVLLVKKSKTELEFTGLIDDEIVIIKARKAK